MNRRTLAVLSMIGVLLLFSLSASAQTRTGRILGQINDENGQPMPGVTVTVASDILMGGTRNAVTGDTGAYRFAALPPGSYTVSTHLPGHQLLSKENVAVTIGGTASANFIMQAAFSEEMIVTAEVALVDTTSSSLSASFSSEFIKDLPTQRNFYDIIQVAPDVSAAAEDSDRMVAGGSNVQSNNWYIDGIETTAPETGTAWIYTNPDDIQEIQVMHIGAPAEYGNMLGATFNVVTKSGSNQFHGGVNAYWIPESLVDSQIDFDSEYPDYHQNEFTDISATLGGPIAKDRLWFYGSVESYRESYVYPGSNPDPALNPVGYNDLFSLKLSWRLNDSNLLDIKGGYVDWGGPPGASQYWELSASAGEKGDDKSWGINFQSIFSDRTFLEARYTGFDVYDYYLSETGSTEAGYIDYAPPGGGPALYFGGLIWPWTYDTTLDQVSVAVTHFADDWLAGDHDFKFGVQASRGDALTLVQTSATGVYYTHYESYFYDDGSEYPYYYRVAGLPYWYGNEQESVSAFVDDSWSVSDRLTLNLGLRYDYHKGIIPSFPRLDGEGNPTGEKIPGLDPVFTWNNISPRIGFAWDVGGNGKTVIRGSFGVYYDGNVGGNWNAPAIATPGLFAYWGPSWNGPWSDEPWWDWSPGEGVNVDPDLKAPRTLQYSIGFEQAIGNNYSFGVNGVYKDTKDLIGWEVMDDGVYEELPWTDPFTGDEYILWDTIENPTLRKGNVPGDINSDADQYWQEFYAIILTFERRFSDFWSMQANYTYSKSTGLIAAYMSQYQSNPLYGSRWGSDPNSFLNASGQRLQGDRPHMFRVQANFQLPWQMRLNTMINLQSGRPYSRLYQLPTYGNPDGLVASAGDPGRHGFQYLWDIGFGKRFSLGNNVAIQADLRLLNALNNTATDWFETTLLAEGDEFIPDTWIKPRRLMLRLGIEF